MSNKRTLQKVGRSAQVGTRSIELLLHDICAHEKNLNPTNSAVVDAIRSSPVLVNTMLRCHERFLRVVSNELSMTATTVNNATNDNCTKVHRVGESHVQTAMSELGMHDILTEAKQIQQAIGPAEILTGVDVSNNKRKRKNERRIKQWTEEEISEQERLLASSKEKFFRGGD